MKKALIGALLLAGVACGVRGQEANETNGRTSPAVTSNENTPSTVTSSAGDFALANPDASAAPAAIPATPAKPKYVVFGDRDDYRWQLGVGLEYFHFQSRAFDANMVGLNTTLSYYTNTWFAVEGNVVTGFGSDVFGSDTRAKIFGGAGGIRIGGRRARWEPFGHALVGGAHLQPQTAFGSKNSLMAQAGGGVDYRIHARLSLRGEVDWVYTTYFNESQNNLQAVAGVVLHF